MNIKPYEIRIIPNDGTSPPSKLADVEIILSGILPGLKLTGASVWRSKKGEPPTILVPSRSYATASGVRYHELIRGEDGEDKKTVREFKQMIRDEYEWFTGGVGIPCPACGVVSKSPGSPCVECGSALSKEDPPSAATRKSRKKAGENSRESEIAL